VDDAQHFEVPTEIIDRSIYAMPQWLRLPVSDLAASTRWYGEAAGFEVLVSMPGPDGSPLLVHLRRFRYQDILLVRAPGPPVAGTASTGFAAGSGTDLAEQARRARAVTADPGRVDGPTRTPWNTVDLTLTDLDGHVVVLSQPVPFDQADPDFSAMIRNLPRGGDGPAA
jgi:catechol 2,3-dioxygenase-like lactoylglutathione lyase family enzyme